MLGHAVGDALGVPVEFCTREELYANPVTDMMGFGSYPVPEGCWSDDTSMAPCALNSLAKGEVNLNEIIIWYNGALSPFTGEHRYHSSSGKFNSNFYINSMKQ